MERAFSCGLFWVSSCVPSICRNLEASSLASRPGRCVGLRMCPLPPHGLNVSKRQARSMFPFSLPSVVLYAARADPFSCTATCMLFAVMQAASVVVTGLLGCRSPLRSVECHAFGWANCRIITRDTGRSCALTIQCSSWSSRSSSVWHSIQCGL